MATIAIRFLTGRAHLHPWGTHPNEGRAEWPPSPWRLLRAQVAVAGQGLTTLPPWDYRADPGRKPRASKKNPNSVWPPGGYEPLPDEWFKAGSGEPDDVLPVSRLTSLLEALSSPPEIWIPRTTFGHTRQYFPIHEGGSVRLTGSPVLDTFSVVDRDQPLVFHWPATPRPLTTQEADDLRLLLARLTYFGRAESWCLAEFDESLPAEIVEGKSHWRCIPLEDSSGPASGEWSRSFPHLGVADAPREHRDYTIERRLAPVQPLDGLKGEVLRLFGELKKDHDKLLTTETTGKLLLRALLRESGQDMKDGLDRPLGSRWVSYGVPRGAFVIPAIRRQQTAGRAEAVHVARYVLSTATVHRPVLPLLTDALLVGEHFRRALMALYGRANGGATTPNLSGKDRNGEWLKGHKHAFFLPEDGDADGFIDHVTVWCPNGFTPQEVLALRSLIRLKQRGGRPDLLVTLTRLASQESCRDLPLFRESTIFVSRTPYVPPRHAYRRSNSGKIRLSERDLPSNQLLRELEMRFSERAQPGWNISVQPLQAPSTLGNGLVQQCAHIPLRDKEVRCISFLRHRRVKEAMRGRPDHGQIGGAWRIEFPHPVPGPIALGYGCHFGLGQFVPAGATFVAPRPSSRRSGPETHNT